eukprot:TRINITY_DN29348_c0_g1_i1.p1 TRINITY_DN29348_c0_g1~~TRINITY_DN29348_c0_g1_i1.p1  ORF type:complete len:885 (+),score=114.75 TRINITY_DN29348_c0_g1_i1:196-2655(+)
MVSADARPPISCATASAGRRESAARLLSKGGSMGKEAKPAALLIDGSASRSDTVSEQTPGAKGFVSRHESSAGASKLVLDSGFLLPVEGSDESLSCSRVYAGGEPSGGAPSKGTRPRGFPRSASFTNSSQTREASPVAISKDLSTFATSLVGRPVGPSPKPSKAERERLIGLTIHGSMRGLGQTVKDTADANLSNSVSGFFLDEVELGTAQVTPEGRGGKRSLSTGSSATCATGTALPVSMPLTASMAAGTKASAGDFVWVTVSRDSGGGKGSSAENSEEEGSRRPFVGAPKTRSAFTFNPYKNHVSMSTPHVLSTTQSFTADGDGTGRMATKKQSSPEKDFAPQEGEGNTHSEDRIGRASIRASIDPRPGESNRSVMSLPEEEEGEAASSVRRSASESSSSQRSSIAQPSVSRTLDGGVHNYSDQRATVKHVVGNIIGTGVTPIGSTEGTSQIPAPRKPLGQQLRSSSMNIRLGNDVSGDARILDSSGNLQHSRSFNSRSAARPQLRDDSTSDRSRPEPLLQTDEGWQELSISDRKPKGKKAAASRFNFNPRKSQISVSSPILAAESPASNRMQEEFGSRSNNRVQTPETSEKERKGMGSAILFSQMRGTHKHNERSNAVGKLDSRHASQSENETKEIASPLARACFGRGRGFASATDRAEVKESPVSSSRPRDNRPGLSLSKGTIRGNSGSSSVPRSQSSLDNSSTPTGLNLVSGPSLSETGVTYGLSSVAVAEGANTMTVAPDRASFPASTVGKVDSSAPILGSLHRNGSQSEEVEDGNVVEELAEDDRSRFEDNSSIKEMLRMAMASKKTAKARA